MRPGAVYVYRDAAGKPLRRKLRFERPKWFAWQSYDAATDTWTSGTRDATSTLYNLHLLATAKPGAVFCVEGEKDADTVTALGLPAVTSGNAGSWQRHHSEQLHEHGCRDAVVVPDHDDAGLLHAYQVARQNLAVGIPTKILKLPDLHEHEDVSDFIARGGTRADILTLTKLTKLVTFADLPSVEPEKPHVPRARHFTHDPRLNGVFLEKLKLPPTVRGRITVLCPFHPEANPSLSLDLTRGLWFCHACGIGGGPVAFYVKWHAVKNGQTVSRKLAWHRLKATYS